MSTKHMMLFFLRSVHVVNDSHLTLYEIQHWTCRANRVGEVNFLGIFFYNSRFIIPKRTLVILKSNTNVYMRKMRPRGVGWFA